MNSMPPFIGQESDSACAIACLRMILAHHGKHITEAALLRRVSLVAGGIDPDMLVTLAQDLGLHADARQLDLDQIAGLVEQHRFPIVLIERTYLDHEFTVHAVLPIRFTAKYVTVLDPLFGERRISRRKFDQARRRLGQWVVVCAAAPE